MTRKDYVLMMCLVTLSGLIGGSLTSWLVSGQVTAQGAVPAARVLQTECLQVVDANGQVRIELSAQPGGVATSRDVTSHSLRDADGNLIPSEDSTQVDPIRRSPSKALVRIRDRSGRVIWTAPPELEAMFLH